MKRLVPLLLVLIFAVLFTGCKNKEKNNSSSSPQSSSSDISDNSQNDVEEKISVAVVTGVDSTLNIRESASTDSSILGKAKAGDKFLLISATAENEFYKIQYNNKDAYVSSKYITIEQLSRTEASALFNENSSSPNSNTNSELSSPSTSDTSTNENSNNSQTSSINSSSSEDQTIKDSEDGE